MASLPEGSQQQLQLQVVQLQQRISELEAEQQQLQSEAERLATANKALQSTANEAAAQATSAPVGVKVVKTGTSLHDTMSLPGTPGAETPTAEAGRRVNYSSDGGSSNAGNLNSIGGAAKKPSRLSSANSGGNTSSKTAAAAGKGSNRPGTAAAKPAAPAVQEEQQRQQGDAGGTESGGKPAGVSYAPQQWEESKQLQAKIENLRWAYVTCCTL